MKTILVCNEKGGTGKSVLASELYHYFDRQGLRTSLYSLDAQYADNGHSQKVEGAEVAVVDTPGVIMSDKLVRTIEGADVVVIPVRPTPNDIEPFTRTVGLVQAHTDVPLVIVVNGANRWRMSTSFMQWLSGKPWAKHVAVVPQSEAIVQAEGLRTSVVNVDRGGKVADAVTRACEMVAQQAGLPAHQPAKTLKKDS